MTALSVDLPWPSRTLHPNAQRWTAEEDAFLVRHHGERTIQELADILGRSRCSLRARITRLGIAKREYWTENEIGQLTDLYRQAGEDGVLRLADFAKSIGRDPKNISRKARELGLKTNLRRRKVEERKIRIPKYSDEEERRSALSQARKQWHLDNDHPRGMKGKQHSEKTRRRLSETSKAAQLLVSEEERSRRVLAAMKKTVARNGFIGHRQSRGSWKAGWREIGGKKNFYRSRWEANYARYLQWLKESGQIREWAHEPETFWFDAIKRGVRSYLPDFRVWENNGTTSLHEVKGWMDSRSKTILKRMAKYHPSQKIILIDGKQYRAIRLKVMRLIEGWEDAARDAHD